MNAAFALSALVAVAATVMMITRRSAVHALLYLVVSLLASAVIMFVLGAAFVAALEVIVYAGAIMVLFVFVIMLIGPESIADAGPGLDRTLDSQRGPPGGAGVGPRAGHAHRRSRPRKSDRSRSGMALFGPYILGAEIAAFLLLAGLVGAFHLGRRRATPAGRAE